MNGKRTPSASAQNDIRGRQSSDHEGGYRLQIRFDARLSIPWSFVGRHVIAGNSVCHLGFHDGKLIAEHNAPCAQRYQWNPDHYLELLSGVRAKENAAPLKLGRPPDIVRFRELYQGSNHEELVRCCASHGLWVRGTAKGRGACQQRTSPHLCPCAVSSAADGSSSYGSDPHR